MSIAGSNRTLVNRHGALCDGLTQAHAAAITIAVRLDAEEGFEQVCQATVGHTRTEVADGDDGIVLMLA